MRLRPICLFLIWTVMLLTNRAMGQNNDALTYLQRISDEYEEVVKAQWDYALAIAGEKNRTRQQQSLDVTISRAINNIRRIPPYKNDPALRDSVVSFLEMNQQIIREDYRNISDMNSLEEHSLDEMRAYLYEQEDKYQRIAELSAGLKREEEQFARRFGIHLVKREDKFSKKFEELNRLFTYYNATYLDFFIAYRQELILFRHIENRNADSISVHLDRLDQQAAQSRKSISQRGGYSGDRSLEQAALAMLMFYQTEATDELKVVEDYYTMVDRLKQMMQDRAGGAQNAEEYNALAREINASTGRLNTVNQSLNQRRADLLNDWNVVSEEFLTRHIR